MNIREAIRQTELALRAYAARDAQGSALIPTESQRPIYLLGAPGVVTMLLLRVLLLF